MSRHIWILMSFSLYSAYSLTMDWIHLLASSLLPTGIQILVIRFIHIYYLTNKKLAYVRIVYMQKGHSYIPLRWKKKSEILVFLKIFIYQLDILSQKLTKRHWGYVKAYEVALLCLKDNELWFIFQKYPTNGLKNEIMHSRNPWSSILYQFQDIVFVDPRFNQFTIDCRSLYLLIFGYNNKSILTKNSSINKTPKPYQTRYLLYW